MWQWLGNLIAGPVLGKAVDAYKAKLDSGNTSERLAADLAARELDVQKREAELQTEYKKSIVGTWYAPANLFGYVMVFHLTKVIIYDNALGLGFTYDLKGNTAIWAGMIMVYWLGTRAVDSVMRIIRK